MAALPHRGGGHGCVGASLRSAQRHRQPPQPHGNYGNIHLTLTPSNEEFQDKGQSNLHHTCRSTFLMRGLEGRSYRHNLNGCYRWLLHQLSQTEKRRRRSLEEEESKGQKEKTSPVLHLQGPKRSYTLVRALGQCSTAAGHRRRLQSDGLLCVLCVHRIVRTAQSV